MRRYRAPVGEGEILAEPILAAIRPLIESNAAVLHESRFADAAREARRELIDLARSYTGAYVGHVSSVSEHPRILLAGHQPTLFHPGVWLKNFALSALAAKHQAVAINLLADNDTIRSAAIRVPSGPPADPRIESIPFDAAGPEVPHEERTILDRAALWSFAERTRETLAGLIEHPLVETYWPRVLAAAERTDRLGLCLAQARHQVEAEWGGRTLELPLSVLCEGAAFRGFAAMIVAEDKRFGQIYNQAVEDYRRAYKIRSRAHPVPELETTDGWQELPFWLWTAADPRRRRAFLHTADGERELSDRGRIRIPLGRATGEEQITAALAAMPPGIRLRPRALVTTLIARLLLSDLFLHGIGGGMYDQVTNAILRDFFGVTPPGYLVLTGTFRLPIARPSVSPDDLRCIDRQLRELNFDPGKHIDPANSAAATLAAERAAWVARELPKGQRRERHEAIRRLDAALQPHLADRRRELLAQRERMADDLRRAQLLGSREFAFCLFPEEQLRAQLVALV